MQSRRWLRGTPAAAGETVIEENMNGGELAFAATNVVEENKLNVGSSTTSVDAESMGEHADGDLLAAEADVARLWSKDPPSRCFSLT